MACDASHDSGRALLAGWLHGTAVVPATLVTSLVTMFHPVAMIGTFLVALGGAVTMRRLTAQRVAGLVLGLCTGVALAYGFLWVMFRDMDI